MKLQQLNKINASAVNNTLTSDYNQSFNIFSKHGKACGEYRNALLKSLNGRTIQFKGFLTDEAKKGNFTLNCVEIRINGALVDTLQHLNVFQDLLANHPLFGGSMKGEGNYSLRVLQDAAYESKCENLTTQDCMVVEGEGIVYSYGAKYSIGTERQVAWALANK